MAPSDAYLTFQADPGRQEYWLLEVDVLNLTTREEKTLYFSSRQYGTKATDTPAHRAYKACITRGFEFSGAVETLNGPIYGILPARSAGSIVLGQILGDLDLGDAPQLEGMPLRDYAFSGRPAVVKHGGYSPQLGRMMDYDEFFDVFIGESDGQPLIATDSVTINLRSTDAKFQYPINPHTYFGCKGAILFADRGTTNQVAAGTSSTFNTIRTSPFSWELLCYFSDNPVGPIETLVSFGRPGFDGYTIERLSDGTIQASTHQSGATQSTISIVFPLCRWTRLSVVFDGADCYIHFNSVDATDTHATHITPATASRTLYFGRDNAGTVFTKSMMSDIRCWSYALTPGDIAARMHRPLDSSEYAATGLVAYWPANDGTGTALDQKVVALGSAGDGTLSGGAVFTPSLMGDTDLQGAMTPHAWGYFDGFSPVQVDVGRQIYQVHNASVEAIDRVDIGGGAATSLDVEYTDLIDMLAVTSTASGKHDTCITPGGTYIRLGGNPEHPVTVAGRGDNTGGTFRSTVSSLVRYITCNMGWYPLTDPTDLDEDSFDDLDTDFPADVGFAYKTEKSVQDVVDFFLQSAGAVGFFRRSSNLFAVKQFKSIDSAGTPTITLTERDIDQSEIEVIENNIPMFRVDIQYKQNYTKLSPTDFTIGVAGSDREKFVLREWRVATQVDRSVKRDYKDAVTLIYQTAIYKWFDAITEAARQLTIFKTRSQGFRVKIKQGRLDLDRMDVVYFDFADRDSNNVRQLRFNSGPTRKMYVLDVADDSETSGSVVTLWRDNV